jgi:uncharacterized membrane protein YdjX (TVP38/TMEM64 family)
MKKAYAIRIIVLVVIVLALLFIAKQTGLLSLIKHNKIGVAELKDYLLSFGEGSIFVLLLIYAMKPLLVVTPISVIAVVTGLIYGPIYGSLYTFIGAGLSGCTGFFISRYLGQGIVDKILRGRQTKIDGDIEKHGFSIMLFLRLAFIFPFDPLSYAAGLSNMKFRHFIFGTMIGIIPEVLVYNYLGTSIDNLFSRKSLFAVLIIAGFGGLSLYLRRRKKIQQGK